MKTIWANTLPGISQIGYDAAQGSDPTLEVVWRCFDLSFCRPLWELYSMRRPANSSQTGFKMCCWRSNEVQHGKSTVANLILTRFFCKNGKSRQLKELFWKRQWMMQTKREKNVYCHLNRTVSGCAAILPQFPPTKNAQDGLCHKSVPIRRNSSAIYLCRDVFSTANEMYLHEPRRDNEPEISSVLLWFSNSCQAKGSQKSKLP